MVQAIAQPKGPLSALASMEDVPEDSRYNKVLDRSISDAQPDAEQKWKDSQLAFSSGQADDGGSTGSMFANASKAQLAQRNKQTELASAYVPTILNAIQSQQAQAQQQAMMKNLLGGPQGGMIGGIAAKYHIAPEAVATDFLFNGGKNIREMIYKNSTPDMKNQDGFMTDMNPATNGYMAGQGGMGQSGAGGPQSIGMPAVTMGTNGETVVRIPDASAKGGFRVIAPSGAVDAVRDYADAKERAKARMDIQTITPANEPPQTNTREALVDALRAKMNGGAGAGAGNGQQSAPGATGRPGMPSPDAPPVAEPGIQAGSFQGTDTSIMGDIQNIKDPQERANAMRSYAMQNQAKGAPQAPAPGAPPQGAQPPGDDLQSLTAAYNAAVDARDPTKAALYKTRLDQLAQKPASMGMPIQSPAEADRQKEAVATEQKNFGGQLGEMRKAQTSVRQLDNAIKMLKDPKHAPTASGLGEYVDNAGAFFGKTMDGAPEADALRTLQGWLTSNVPRMEGPQSNFDVANYQQMTGMVGNAKLPIATRLAAAQKARELIMDAAPKEFGSGFNSISGSGQGAPKVELSGMAPGQGPRMPTLDEVMAEKRKRTGGK